MTDAARRVELQRKAFEFLESIARGFRDGRSDWTVCKEYPELFRLWPDQWAFPDVAARSEYKNSNAAGCYEIALQAKRILFAYAPTFARAIEALSFPRHAFTHLLTAVIVFKSTGSYDAINGIGEDGDDELALIKHQAAVMDRFFALITPETRSLFELVEIDLSQPKYAGGLLTCDPWSYPGEMAHIFEAFHHETLRAVLKGAGFKCRAKVVALGLFDDYGGGGRPAIEAHVLVPDDLTTSNEDAEGTLGRSISVLFHWDGFGRLSTYKTGSWKAHLETPTPRLRRWRSLYIPSVLIKGPIPAPPADPYDMTLYDLPLLPGPKSLRRILLERFFKPGKWNALRVADQRRICREFGLMLLGVLAPKRTHADAGLDDHTLAAREDAEEQAKEPELFAQNVIQRYSALRATKRARFLLTTTQPGGSY